MRSATSRTSKPFARPSSSNRSSASSVLLWPQSPRRDTPIMADESVFTPAEALDMVRGEIADLVSIKIMKSGGIVRAREIATIAEAGGITAYGGTMFEGGLAIAAGLHMVAATPNISLGAEFYTSTFVMEVEVLKTPIVIDNGSTRAPTGAGLGVEVDEDSIRRISTAHFE